MESVTQVQILDEAFCILLPAKATEKGINISVLSATTGK